MSALRILVADDHQVVRRGLRAILEERPGWTVVAEVANGRDAVAETRRLKPDVAILDISMPEQNGLDAAREIQRISPRTELLILTVHGSEQVVRDIWTAGARGYVHKLDACRELIAAVEALSHHKAYIGSSVAETVLDCGRKMAPDSAEAPLLTPRERGVVQLLAEGKSGKEVATALGLSVKTVGTHRTNIMRKLRVHSVADLVRYAIRNQIVQP